MAKARKTPVERARAATEGERVIEIEIPSVRADIILIVPGRNLAVRIDGYHLSTMIHRALNSSNGKAQGGPVVCFAAP
jgi:hypothetical protein